MRRPSTRLSRCIKSTTIVNIVFLFGVVLSFFPASISATTTSTSTRTTRLTTTTKPYYILPFFLPDSEPLSLVASVIHKTTIITTTIIRPTTTITSLSVKTLTTSRLTTSPITENGESKQEDEIILQLDCPAALIPENEACRAARIYPAIVTGRRVLDDNDDNPAQTHVWKGETTYLVGDDTTTTWTCWQGMSLRTGVPAPTTTAVLPNEILPTEILNPGITPNPAVRTKRNAVGVGEVVPYAQCVSTIVQDQGSRIRFVTRRYDECYFYRHMVPVIVGVGDGMLNERGQDEVERMNNGWESSLSRLGCDVASTSRTMWAGTVTDTAAVAAGTGEAAGDVKTSGSAGGLRGGPIMLGSGYSVVAWTVTAALMEIKLNLLETYT